MQRSEVAADARFFGLGGRASGPRLRDGTYRLWNTDPGHAFGPGDDPLYITMPVQMVVADAAHPSGVPRQLVGRHGDAARGRGGRRLRARPGRDVRAPDGRRPAALLGDGGHPRARAARLGVADRGARAAAGLGAGAPSRAVGLRQRAGGAADRRGLSGARSSARRGAPGHRSLRRASGVHGRPGAFPEAAGARRGAAPGRRSGWCRSSTRRSRPSRATPCTTAGSPRTPSCGTPRGGRAGCRVAG